MYGALGVRADGASGLVRYLRLAGAGGVARGGARGGGRAGDGRRDPEMTRNRNQNHAPPPAPHPPLASALAPHAVLALVIAPSTMTGQGRTWRGTPKIREINVDYALERQAKKACTAASKQMAQAAQVQQLSSQLCAQMMHAAMQVAVAAAVPVTCSATPKDLDDGGGSIGDCAPLLLDDKDDGNECASVPDDEAAELAPMLRMALRSRKPTHSCSVTQLRFQRSFLCLSALHVVLLLLRNE